MYTIPTSSVIIPCLPEICNFKINLFYIYFIQHAMITLKLWLSLAMNRTEVIITMILQCISASGSRVDIAVFKPNSVF